MSIRSTLPRANIFGIGVHAIDLPTAVATLMERIAQRQKTTVVVSPAYTLTYARLHEDFKQVVDAADLVVPDGMPIVMLSRWQGFKDVGRVYGPNLMLALSEATCQPGYTHFYYGGAAEVPELLKENLEGRFPGLQVVGTYSPPFRALTPAEDQAIVDQINAANPDVVWVGLGSPKQDRWIYEHRDRINAPVMIGVGAAFDFHIGRVRQAPAWMQRMALEWLFRLLMEPRRLWKRYIIFNGWFLFFVGLQITGLRRWSLPE